MFYTVNTLVETRKRLKIGKEFKAILSLFYKLIGKNLSRDEIKLVEDPGWNPGFQCSVKISWWDKCTPV